MIVVETASDNDRARWSDYLDRHDIRHHALAWEWRQILRKTFGHEPFYLIASDSDGTVVGILPLILIKSFLFGRALVSLPYLNGGGAIAESEEAFRALFERAVGIGRAGRAAYIELRHREPLQYGAEILQQRSHKAAMLLPLQPTAEEQFQSFPAKLRSQIRRPSKSGLSAEVVRGKDISRTTISAFYSVFSQNMRDLGTPVYPRSLFANTVAAFRDTARVILVSKDQIPVAAAITIGWRGNVEIPWASSLRSYNTLAPNMLLYWEAIKGACEDGAKVFDFGRSTRDSGPYRFKEQWGAQPLELKWYGISLRGDTLPDVNPNSPKFRTLVSCWQKLPVPLANFLGPWITRSIP
jgi:FemAB-related protein (PEP-CTERM system-associated)